MSKKLFNQKNTDLVLPAVSDGIINIRINRNILMAISFSLLLHLSLLWLFAPKLFSMGSPEEDSPPLEITLGPPQKKETAKSEPEPVLPLPEIKQQEPTKPSKTRPLKRIAPSIEVAKQSETKVPKPAPKEIIKRVPKPKPEKTSPAPLPGEDFKAYIKRQKESKLASQGLSKKDVEEVLASNNPQSDGEKRDAKIRENLQLDGTNGIFEVRDISDRSATFSFKGWRNNINTARLELFDVSGANRGSVKKAVIRKMIEIIRREYDGDFNWDSRRLKRVINLSARIEDNAALEEFMLYEIFSDKSYSAY